MRVADSSTGSSQNGGVASTSAPRREKRRGGRRNRQSAAAAAAVRAMLSADGSATAPPGYPLAFSANAAGHPTPHGLSAPRQVLPQLVNHGLPGQFTDMNALPLLRASEQAAATEYDTFLNDLTFNSKDVINSLTKIAGENLPSFNAIACVLEKRILLMPPHMKLPFLYLVDSICKNIGAVYVNRFRQTVGRCFLCAYECSTPSLRMSMQRLLNTWPPVFGPQAVDSIRVGMERIIASIQIPASPALVSGNVGRAPFLNSTLSASQVPKPMGLYNPLVGPALHSGQASTPSQSSPASALGYASAGPVSHGQAASVMSQIETLFRDVMRKVSAGQPVASSDLQSLTALISSQTQSATISPFDRDNLRGLQSQLTALTSSSQSLDHAAGAAPPAAIESVDLHRGVMPPNSLHISGTSPVAAGTSRPCVPRACLGGLRSQPSAPAVGSAADLGFTQLKNGSHSAIVRSLYSDLSYLSKSDGMRFKNQLDLRTHLDWLFVQNKRKRARARAAGGSGVSRCWNESTASFLGMKPDAAPSVVFAKPTSAAGTGVAPAGELPGEPACFISGDGEIQPSTASITCEARGDDETCPLCCEGFESSWDDDKQAWMLIDAVRPHPEGPAYHSGCFTLGDGNVKDQKLLQRDGNVFDAGNSVGEQSTTTQLRSAAEASLNAGASEGGSGARGVARSTEGAGGSGGTKRVLPEDGSARDEPEPKKNRGSLGETANVL
jgi:pre-mRNA cleavage complex 2 protein Pcf11